MFALIPLFGGCYVHQSVAPLPIRATYAAAGGFVLEPRAGSADTMAQPCRVRRAEVEVGAIRGDTVEFLTVLSTERVVNGAACRLTGPGFIDLAVSPAMVRERPKRNMLATSLAAVPLLLGVAGIISRIRE